MIQPLSGSIANLQNINKSTKELNANGNVNIFSKKGIQILSGKDSLEYEYESKNSSLGSLLTKEQIESLQKASTVSSLINAKEVNLVTDDGIVVKGSQIQAQTVNMMAQYLALISDKNSESYSNFTDGSGVVIREIINQGYVKEEAIPSIITAQDINLNGKKLLETSLNPDNLLKQISSEYDLNDEQIVQIKAELNNKEWYDKTTSLSKMGMIIVQVVSTISTYGALGTAISNVSSNVMIKAAITSMVSQLGSALATSVITGNSLNVDVEKILVNSLKAAALAGVIEQIDTNLGYVTEAGKTLSYADKVSQQILHGFARASVYGGNIESILANSLGNVAFEYVGHNLYSENSQYPQIQEYVPKTLVHSIIGGTLSELAGGDFSSGAIATAVSHNVAEYLKNKLYSEFDPKNPPFDNNDPQAKQDYAKQQEEIIKGLSSVVSGAVVLATHENVTDKELDIAQDMGASVVENNALFLPLIYIVGGLMTAYDTYSTYEEEGAYEAVKSLIIDGTITAVGGGLFKVGGKVFNKLDDAYDYFKSVKNSGDLNNLIDIKYSNISTAKSYQSNVPRDLKEQILWKDVVENPSSGKHLDKIDIKDPRFKPEDGWQKMSKVHQLPDGRRIEIHYQYNKLVDKAYDIKLDSPKYN